MRIYVGIYVCHIYVYIHLLIFTYIWVLICTNTVKDRACPLALVLRWRDRLEQKEGTSQCKWKGEASRRQGGRWRPSEDDSPTMTPCNWESCGSKVTPTFPCLSWKVAMRESSDFPHLKVDRWTPMPEESWPHTEATKELSCLPSPFITIRPSSFLASQTSLWLFIAH